LRLNGDVNIHFDKSQSQMGTRFGRVMKELTDLNFTFILEV